MRDHLDFSGKTALVVGGASGIGNAIAQSLRTAGGDVYVWGTRPNASHYSETEGSNLNGLQYAQLDVSDFAALEAYAPPFESLDTLILSQGLVLYKRQEFTIEGFRKVLDVNLTSLLACAMKFRRMLAERQGAIVIVSSSAAYHATIGNPAYNASKAGATGLTRTLAQSFAKDGVRVNAVAPGFIPTKMTKITTDDPARREATLSRIPLGRFGTGEEMASVALFLASPMSSYIVGQTILADGGMLL